MGDKISVCNEKKISMNGYFDVKKTFSNLTNFMENTLRYDLAINDYNEEKNGKKTKISAGCEAKRDLNDTFKIVLKFKLALEGEDIKGEIKNKPIIIQKGEGSITMNGYTEANWDATRGSGPLASFVGEIYDRYVGNDEMAKTVKTASNDVERFFKRFKTHFNSKIN